MTNDELARSYLYKATKRLRILDLLFEEEDYSDVVREAQEVVELAQKAMLRQVGIDPPRWHDVGGILLENREKFPEVVASQLEELAEISKWLRRERELAFYGEIDFIPTEEYTKEDALKAIEGARKTVKAAEEVIEAVL
ncbi:MAG: DNA-binding protein [Deltaproteobacteria bacterium]|nr:MAG: DNA-binding protein [Deltaproteobacteria bacterium]